MATSSMGSAAPSGYRRPASGGAYLSAGDPTRWGAWAHQGHRLWASMSEAFWVYVYKVQRCPQLGSHDWTSCPYAHKGERARRRDPRRFDYVAVACPDYRASQHRHAAARTGAAPTCARGLRCRYAHGVFELWLHPARFRTRMCDAGAGCSRRICFFAHCAAERRSEDGSAPPVGMLPPPPLIRAPPPPPPRAAATATTSPYLPLPRHVDLLAEAVRGRLRICGGAGDDAASSSCAVATAPAQDPSLPDDEDDGGREAEEDSDANDDYPHFDLIMDMVMI